LEKFDFSAIEDFDKHISISIPNYNGLFEVFQKLAVDFTPMHGTLVDLGCSTGNFLSVLPKIPDTTYIGVDVVDFHGRRLGEYEFICDDAIQFLKKTHRADVIVSMFFLQFLSKHQRAMVIRELNRLVKGGATLLLAEKTLIDDVKVNKSLHDLHLQKKRELFTDTEILDKEKQLASSMFCLTSMEIERELDLIGSTREQVWQSFGFKGWVIHE